MKRINVGDYVFAKVIRPQDLPEKIVEGIVISIKKDSLSVQTEKGGEPYKCYAKDAIVVPNHQLWGSKKAFAKAQRRKPRKTNQ